MSAADVKMGFLPADYTGNYTTLDYTLDQAQNELMAMESQLIVILMITFAKSRFRP